MIQSTVIIEREEESSDESAIFEQYKTITNIFLCFI